MVAVSAVDLVEATLAVAVPAEVGNLEVPFMKKILSVAELQNSEWPKLFEEALGDNLVSAFVHGDCLMEGFSALESPWTVSFILKSNSVEDMLPLQKLTAKAKHENIVFNHVFSRFEIKSSQDVFPLEFLHIKSKNVTLCGETPLADFSPNLAELRIECERELRGLLVHLRRAFLYLKEDRNPHGIYVRSQPTLLPLLYGVYFLATGNYPENHDQVYEMFPGVRIPNMTNDNNVIVSNINKYIEAVTAIVNQVDAMKV